MNPTNFYSRRAHIERLEELLEWAKTNEQVQKCLKHNALKKANRLIKEEGLERFGVGSRVATEYAKIIITCLKTKTSQYIYAKWGFVQRKKPASKF